MNFSFIETRRSQKALAALYSQSNYLGIIQGLIPNVIALKMKHSAITECVNPMWQSSFNKLMLGNKNTFKTYCM